MDKKPQSCGYGKKKNLRRVSHFGADFQSFYKPGTAVNTFLTPEVKNCLNVIYGNEDSSYTNKSYSPDVQNVLGFGKSKNRELLKKHFKELNKF